ncbi:NADH-quinone oxidoreductase subunit A [Isoptericola sediminis]|uniref:NADH-quinone oxidoreductase subunit n=1 Tax=Isoptericola sediminis TaxID=2733572 RepID=A0A849K507_9MICO|nr:NADH-quinone oxidoreductase subunit A [Isoptericola sediminis]NNU26237.1 NADH-quinone oxidoreductase subunit A [Isoptericola sediminis]
MALGGLVAGIALLLLGLRGAATALAVARTPAMSLPFESGVLPTQHAVSRFHVRWYAVSVLFLAFDMEMVFMYPWAVVVAQMGATSVVEMFGFLAVLLVGVVYAWREGALRWA